MNHACRSKLLALTLLDLCVWIHGLYSLDVEIPMCALKYVEYQYCHSPTILNTMLALAISPPGLVAVQVWVPPSLEETAARVIVLIVDTSFII